MRRGVPVLPLGAIALCIFAAIMVIAIGRAEGEELPSALSVDALEFEYSADGGIVVARGNVRAVYSGVELQCDELTVDLKAQVLYVRGPVKISGKDYQGESRILKYDLAANTGRLEEVRGKAGEACFSGNSLDVAPSQLTLVDGYITKCDLAVPCWRFSARRLIIYPGKKIVAEGVWVWISRLKLLPLPRISIPIYEDKSGSYSLWGRNLPRPAVTYDRDYGLSVTLTYPYILSNGEELLLDAAYRERAGYEAGASLDHGLGDLGTLTAKARYRTWEGPEAGLSLSGLSLAGALLNADILYKKDRGLVGGVDLATTAGNLDFNLDARRDYISGRIVDALPRLGVTLKSTSLGNGAPNIGIDVALGRFREGGAGSFISRVSGTLRMTVPAITLGGGFTASAGADLGGFWYSTGDSLSVLSANLGVSKSFGTAGRAGLRYSWRGFDGKTPFAFDSPGKGNALTGSGLMYIDGNWTLGVKADYDLDGKDFTDVDWEVTRHLHCFDVRLSWREKRDEIALDIKMVR